MRIVHVGPFKIGTIHGTFNALWTLARSQAKKGHEVTIVRLGKAVTSDQSQIAKGNGVHLVGWPHNARLFWRDEGGRFARLIDDLQPDVVHLEYVRIPKYFVVSRLLRKSGIPFVISLHGGMNSIEMTRKRIRKLAYWYLIERGIHARASGLHFVSAKEKGDYELNWKLRAPVAVAVANPSQVPPDLPLWGGIQNPKGPRIAYFGRYDPWHKGIDLAAGLVRELNHRKGLSATLHLYGSKDLFEAQIQDLMNDFSDVNIADHGFLFGREMYEAMREQDLYIQYSRFEAFGMSLVEAMMLGVPAIVSENCDLAKEITDARAALVVPMDPAQAADLVAAALSEPSNLTDLAARGRAWAVETCDPGAVEARMHDFYLKAGNAPLRGAPSRSEPPG
jgi:glycosyltransferase involved in cell wall biosynthesis